MDENGLPVWPAPERNKQPILDVLLELLSGRSGTLLEIAAATGQHAHHFAPQLPAFVYQPSDYDEDHLATLRARHQHSTCSTMRAPVALDVTWDKWPLESADVIYNANMVHIAPPAVSEGLFRGAGRLLSPGGLLITYGPYRVAGEHTSESNARFDESLKSRDASWGVRDLEELRGLARANGLVSRDPLEMPANNLLVVWDKL